MSPMKEETSGSKKTRRNIKKRKGGMPPKKTFSNKTTAQKYLSISEKTADTYPNLSNAFYDGSLDKMESASDRRTDYLPRPYHAERHAISPIPDDVAKRTISPIPYNVAPKGGKKKTKKRRTRSKRHSKRKHKHQRK